MTNRQLKKLLASAGLPVVYHAWPPKKVPPPPYLVFLRSGSANMFADGKVYLRIDRYQVELYTLKKDPAAEEQVQRVLDGAGIPWQAVHEEYLKDEGMFEILYEIEV